MEGTVSFVLFGSCDPSRELNVFVKRPLKDFKKAREKLNYHFSGGE